MCSVHNIHIFITGGSSQSINRSAAQEALGARVVIGMTSDAEVPQAGLRAVTLLVNQYSTVSNSTVLL